MADLNLAPALSELLNQVGRPEDFRRKWLTQGTLHNVKILGGLGFTDCRFTNCIVASKGTYSKVYVTTCYYDNCIIARALVRSKSILRNTILINCEVYDSELHDCLIIQGFVVNTKADNCEIRKKTSLDLELKLPSLLDLSNWEADLDMFPLDLEDLYGPFNYDQWEDECTASEYSHGTPRSPELRFVRCEITRSQTSEAEILLSKISSGLASDCEIYSTVITHLTAHHCNIEYSELRGSRVEESNMVHCILKACTDNGQIIKYRAPGVSLSGIPPEVRMQIFEHVFGNYDDVYRFSVMPALVEAFRGTPELYNEALHVVAQKNFFELQFPESFDDHRIPFNLLRRLSFRGDKTVLYKSEEHRYYPPSLLAKYRGDYPRVPHLRDLHMSISVRDEPQVQDDFRVILDFARKHALERFSITHEEKTEHHTRYETEPPHKAVLRQYISNEIDRITRELGIQPLRYRMTVYETNGHYLQGGPAVYIPKHHWGGYQYTWTWVSAEGTKLKWVY